MTLQACGSLSWTSSSPPDSTCLLWSRRRSARPVSVVPTSRICRTQTVFPGDQECQELSTRHNDHRAVQPGSSSCPVNELPAEGPSRQKPPGRRDPPIMKSDWPGEPGSGFVFFESSWTGQSIHPTRPYEWQYQCLFRVLESCKAQRRPLSIGLNRSTRPTDLVLRRGERNVEAGCDSCVEG